MVRVALYIAGISATLAAVVAYRRKREVVNSLPIQQAADMLRQAWANNHTTV